MAKIRRNSHKARTERNRIKNSVARYRSKTYSSVKKHLPAKFKLSPEEDVKAQQNIVRTWGVACGIDPKEIEEDLLTLRSEILADYENVLNDV